MSESNLTCDLPGRKLANKRFCPHPEITGGGPSILVEYSKCASCPFRQQENTVELEAPKPPELIEKKTSKVVMPSIIQQASNFGTAIFKAATTGFATVDNETQEKRLEICRGCEFFLAKESRCSKCGCFMQLKSKLESGSCPEGKW